MDIRTRGERFKDARTVINRNGKQTMAVVSAATGVSKSMIHDLENDEIDRGVDYREVKKLAVYYGVSVDWLLCVSDHYSFKEDVQSSASYTGLSVESIEALHRIATQGSDIERDSIRFLNREIPRKNHEPVFSDMELYVSSTLIEQTLPDGDLSDVVRIRYGEAIWDNSVGSLLREAILSKIKRRLEYLRKSTGERDISDIWEEVDIGHADYE